MKTGFIFDLDGVITETDEFHYTAWKNEVSKVGINFTREQNATLKGLPRMDTLLGILKLHNLTNKYSQKELVKMADSKNIEYVKSLETKITKKNILPGIKKLLKQIKKNNGRLSIASSSHNAPLILEKVGLKNYFEFIVNPKDIKNGKPTPDIYIAAAKGINTKIENCVGFEDAMPGVVGLVKAKIKTVAITWGDKGDWNIADIVYKSTKEIKYKDIIK